MSLSVNMHQLKSIERMDLINGKVCLTFKDEGGADVTLFLKDGTMFNTIIDAFEAYLDYHNDS